MEQFFNQILESILINYSVSIILLTFMILYYFIKKPTKKEKFLISLFVGIILGIVWFYFIEPDLPKLIVTFLFSVGLYKWIKEPLFKILNINYDDK